MPEPVAVEGLRFGEGVWGREKLKWGVGVDAVA
jgi:hypothetical protein